MLEQCPDLPILLVDDDEPACEYYRAVLEASSINNIIECNDSSEVMPLLRGQDVKVILLDLMMPHISGKELLEQIKSEFPDIPVIMQTAVGDLETAVGCMRKGAFDYLVKPIEMDRIISTVKRALEHLEIKEENFKLKQSLFSEKLECPGAFSEIITNNKSMHSTFRYIESIATTSRPVLVSGETGAGKELIAKAIHHLSGRKGPLVTVNIAGLDDNVFSDTLFGHKRGAFTGAEKSRSGLIKQARGGTLFLDEIGDMEVASQVKLLRLLQEGEYYPLGSDVKELTDARIIVATNQDIDKLIDDGRFRKDLYYRLADHKITVPPLRERLDDLDLLVDHFVGEASSSLEKKKPFVPKALVPLLSSYHVPGNVRELKSIIFDAVSRNQGSRLPMAAFDHLIDAEGGDACDKPVVPNVQTLTSKEIDYMTVSEIFGSRFPKVREVEELMIIEAMKRTGGNKSVVAKLLGVSRPTLNKRLIEIDIQD